MLHSDHLLMEFDELARARAEVLKFVPYQAKSIHRFYDDADKSYRITAADERLRSSERKVQGLTSTFTCLESRIEAGPTSTRHGKDATDAEAASALLGEFGARALLAPASDWRSDNSGWAYCRLRSLGTIARHATSLLAEHEDQVAHLLASVWEEARDKHGGSFGICEMTDDPERASTADEPLPGPDSIRRYTPNSYLTYWAVFVGLALPDGKAKTAFSTVRKPLQDWLQATLAEQIAFHEAKSPHADPQQLAWSIAGVVRCTSAADLVKNARQYDLVNQGLIAFFEQQHGRGDWDRGKPLFNYKLAGTAYCYGYETLAELLATATDKGGVAAQFRQLLKPFAQNLFQAFSYARDIAIPLNSDPTERGWGSGHQPTRREPESWATASVYRFMHRLRILLGVWSNEEAQRLLDARPAKDLDLAERGASWNVGFGSTGAQLSCYFALPFLARGDEEDVTVRDPDKALIPKEHGRSAILFGPPGTGKTTMVEGVARQLDWPFIEITPAQFLDSGLDSVSARADLIFRQMMELDRCVVLLDEIDELVKNRTNDAEALERFFTTTMLPRLARLWDMGKIIFFANTNDIGEIDSAIRRSQRFDAAILVLPPGAEAKSSWLDDAGLSLDTKAAGAIEKLLQLPVGGKRKKLLKDSELVWFPLARFDQRETLVAALKKNSSPVSANALKEALKPIGRSLARQDWTNFVRANDELHQQASDVARALLLLGHAQRRGDLRMHVLSDKPLEGAALVDSKRGIWAVDSRDDDPQSWAKQNGLSMDSAGRVTRP